jgi:recombination protein RecR
MQFSSILLSEAVESFSSLPGIGKKTALRLVLHLLEEDPNMTENMASKLVKMRQNIRHCQKCFNISDHDICQICTNPKRDKSLVCVVRNIKDIIAIEETGHFFGVYHVLGNLISPIDGIGPEDIRIAELVSRVGSKEIKEIIMAISPSIEGETTIFYISKKLSHFDVSISTIARGVSFGGELEYADEITLGRSIISRVKYER